MSTKVKCWFCEEEFEVDQFTFLTIPVCRRCEWERFDDIEIGDEDEPRQGVATS